MQSPNGTCSLSFLHHLLHLLLLILFSILVQSQIGSSNADSEFYEKCGKTFSCGNTISGVGYPFRGADDPDYCGYPSLVLSCDGRTNTTNINILNIKYRVVEIEQSSQTMRIAREDTMGSACPTVMANTTLDYAVFDYASSCMNYTFLYGCQLPPGLMGHVSCGGDGAGAYVVPVAMGPRDCDASVIVSGEVVTAPVDAPLNTTELGEALRRGFQIRWKIGIKSCDDCTATGGRCGYDSATNATVCYCRNPPYVSYACAAADYGAPPPVTENTLSAVPKPKGMYIMYSGFSFSF